MKPFQSAAQMLNAHEHMFGEAGRVCAELVLKWADTLFAVPLNALNVRVVLAPVELGPYNRHYGYISTDRHGEGALILGNRHIVNFQKGTLVLVQDGYWGTEDFVVHELTHERQRQLLQQYGWKKTRGDHRDRGWYQAIAEACPKYLGVEFPESAWPTGPRARKGTNPLTEVEVTHWPRSMRLLAMANDPRLPKIAKAA